MSKNPLFRLMILLSTCVLLVSTVSACGAKPTVPNVMSGTEVTQLQVSTKGVDAAKGKVALLLPPSSLPEAQLPTAIVSAEELLKDIMKDEYPLFQKGLNAWSNQQLSNPGASAADVNRQVYQKVWTALQTLVNVASKGDFIILVLPAGVMDSCPSGTEPSLTVPGQCNIVS